MILHVSVYALLNSSKESQHDVNTDPTDNEHGNNDDVLSLGSIARQDDDIISLDKLAGNDDVISIIKLSSHTGPADGSATKLLTKSNKAPKG